MTSVKEPATSRLDELLAADEDFRASMPDPDVEEARTRPGLPLAERIATLMQAYADRPAIAERARRAVTDPSTGRTTHEILDRFESITYGELWSRITSLVAWWGDQGDGGLHADEVVCMIGFGSTDFTTVDLAAVHAGAVSAPLQMNAPIDQLVSIVAEAEPRWIAAGIDHLELATEVIVRGHRPAGVLVFDVLDGDDGHREALDAARARLASEGFDGPVVTIDDAVRAGSELPEPPPFVGSDPASRLATIYYTSGSTGTPKGAMYSEKMFGTSFTGRARKPIPMVSLNYLPMNHAFGRSTVMATLAAGGVLHFGASSDLSTFLEDVRLTRPSFLPVIPRVCEMLYQRYKLERRDRAPGADDEAADPDWLDDDLLTEMRHDLLGGRLLWCNFGSAPLSDKLRAFTEALLGYRLPDNYGTTEISGAIRNTRVMRPPVIDYKLVDVAELGYFTTDQPHPRGELLVKSENMMLGYYKRPDVTAEVFDDDGYYRTGDIMAELEPDRLVYVDRRNNVIKLAQGEFVAISQLEVQFSGAHPAIHQVYLYGSSEQAFLLAVVVPDAGVLGELGVAGDEQATRRTLREAIAEVAADEQLHPYEVPRDFIVEHEPFSVENGLLAGAGKHRRPKLKEAYGARLEEMYAAIAAERDDELERLRREGGDQPVIDTVCGVVEAVLGLEPIDRASDPSFVGLGGDSLSAVECSILFDEIYGVDVPANVIGSPTGTLHKLAEFIERARAGDSDRATFASVHGRDATEVRAADLTLDRFIDGPTLDAAATAERPVDEIRTVLVTGANGYLGRFICLDWLERFAGTDGRVISIVRGADDADARRRVDEVMSGHDPKLATHFAELAATGLEVLAGDLGEQRLGLSSDAWDRLTAEVDLIVHPAAMVNHVLSYQQLFGPNVFGTAELIRMAITGRLTRFANVSTVAAAFAAGGTILDEDDDVRTTTPTRPMRDDVYADGYALSKWAGEVLLREAHDLLGLPVTVFRSDMIMAHSRWAGQINVPDIFTRWLMSIVVTGLAPRSFYVPTPISPHYDGLPVDFTAEAVSTLGAAGNEGHQTFHVVNPHDDGVSLDTFVDWIAEAGHSVTRIDDYDDWLARFETALRHLPEDQRQRSMLPLLHQLRRPAKPVAGALVDATRFAAGVREHDIGDGGAIPHLDADYVHKYLDDLSVVGLI